MSARSLTRLEWRNRFVSYSPRDVLRDELGVFIGMGLWKAGQTDFSRLVTNALDTGHNITGYQCNLCAGYKPNLVLKRRQTLYSNDAILCIWNDFFR